MPRQAFQIGVTILCAAALTGRATATFAQQRPLVTEDPEVIGTGRMLVEAGVAYERDIEFPASGLRGNLLTVPSAGVSVGLGSIVEVQLDGVLRRRLAVTNRTLAPLSELLTFSGDTTSGVGDFVLATKVRVAPETPSRPAVGLRFATKLPNASNETGLGLDTMDFFSSLLVGKTVRSIRVVGNLGLGILSDPTNATRQNDVVTLGASLARALTDAVELVGEVNGHTNTRSGEPPPGTESRATMRIGARLTRGTMRLDAAFLTGLTVRDSTWGLTVGATYVWDALNIP